MLPGLTTLIATMRFEHPWLEDEFVEESRRIGRSEQGKKHHHVPQMYLRRWAVDGKVQPTQVDSQQAHRPQPPKEVAYQNNFYSLPEVDGTMDLPLKWIETHLARIESECACHLDALTAWGAGVVSDVALKRDLSVFLGLQITRTVGNRQRAIPLVEGPDSAKRLFLRKANPQWSPAQIEESMNRRQDHPKHEALDLMIKDVRNVVADALYQREWAVYRTASPLVASDDPVVFLAGPPLPRSAFVGAMGSAVVLYPVGPHCLLVMLRPGLRHRGPYRLDAAETLSINTEIVAAATKTAFERPGDDIAVNIAVPPRPVVTELDDEQARNLGDSEALQHLLQSATPRTRWTADAKAAPDWPVSRWYAG
ncbi:DUF4238 domain-containing protein [Rhodococcus oryzae]|uniref:DUF4238 domain-containing protein n=1 Tax=Rhodococcus oryzae TaxID=2571143 RepID=A0ABY2RNI4_9NOCA|nr:DUF4238 domain-containing protein [Rhodococcus oryzae]TJZ80028.1 DUF4238 domain-containing protein [Rhodococcus oryzae]